MLDLISVHEKVGMANYIKNYAFLNGGPSTPQASIDYILRIWKTQKQKLFEAFGHQLILEREFHLEKSQDEMERTMTDYIYRQSAYRFICNLTGLTHVGGFYEYDTRIQHLINIPTLVKNVWDKDDFNLVLPNKLRPLRVQKGMKIMKILAKIAAAHNLDHFEDFRLAHSMALNDNVRSGVMRLSIHPFDFMTLSDSKYNWTSCMDWDGGEYRAGTVEMMNSNCTVVAYIKGKDSDYGYGCNFQWPGKQWRELFCITDSIITNVRAYPYRSNSLTTFVLNWLKELVEENTEWQYLPEIFDYNTYCYSGSLMDGRHINISPDSHLMYNDFTDDQKAYISEHIGDYYQFNYSGPSECMWCGEEDGLSEVPCLLCEDCEPLCKCQGCDAIVDETYELEGYHYCSYCYDEYASTCEISGNVYHTESMEYIYLSPDGGRTIFTDYKICVNYDEYISHGKSNLADEQWSQYFTCARPQKAFITPPGRWWNETVFYVCLEDLTGDGEDLFWWDENSLINHSTYSEKKNYSFEAQKTAVDF